MKDFGFQSDPDARDFEGLRLVGFCPGVTFGFVCATIVGMRDDVDGGVVHDVVGGDEELGQLWGSAARSRARHRSLHHFLLFVGGFRVEFESDTTRLRILTLQAIEQSYVLVHSKVAFLQFEI